MLRNRVLVVDDEDGVRFAVGDFLRTNDFDVETAENCRRAEEVFRVFRPDAVVLDYLMPDGSALDLLPRLRQIDSGVPLVILTAHGSIELAVQAIKEGAEHFLTKPVQLPALLIILQRLLESQRARQVELARLTQRARERVDPFVGTSSATRELVEQAKKIVATESPVLIHGETGSGKGVLARWLHDQGPRKNEAFVDLNCASLSRELMETELFGHEKGAFTGATGTKRGLLELAHRGTIFLDEIGDMDLQVQPKFLIVLEEQRFRRLGDVRDRSVDVRIITATHQDLGKLAREGRFRSDLYYRISAIPLRVPPLRERIEDIPLLARQLVRRCANEQGRSEVRLSCEAEEALNRYRWSGNVRELRNVLDRAVLLTDSPVIGPRDLHFDAEVSYPSPARSAGLTLRQVERDHIERVLREEGGHVGRTARRLAIPRSTLYQKLKAFGIKNPS